jgi:hypothetical protein
LQERVEALRFGGIAAIVTPRTFIDVTRQMLSRNPVMDTEDLSLQLAPIAFDCICVGAATDIFAIGVIDGDVWIFFAKVFVAKVRLPRTASWLAD